MNDDPLMGVPLWYQDIFSQGESDGFYRKLGNHAVNYIERDPMQLVVTFDNLAEAGGRHYARDACYCGQWLEPSRRFCGGTNMVPRSTTH